ncbi:MAG: hypothetical protein KAX38_06265 [Candidatus Krumholzibacteria bacterium]|nr:hypothetical protein [Candidatus Krumholzibacteria bacterium]
MTGEKENRGMWGGLGVLFFFLRFLAASIALYLVYTMVGTYYAKLVAYGAKPLLALFKYKIVIEKALAITEDISLNPVVYLSLVIAVAKVPVVTRLKAALWGVLILTAANITTVFLAFLSAYEGSEQLWTGTEFFGLTINFFLPLLLWILLMPIKLTFPLRGKSKST